MGNQNVDKKAVGQADDGTTADLEGEEKSDSGRIWRTIPGKAGIVYREHPTRKHHRKPDRFLAIRYRNGQGKRSIETLGWASAGWKVEKAASYLHEIKENIRTGQRPQSLKEKRAMETAARVEEARLASRARLKEITFRELAALYEEWAEKNRVSGPHVKQLLRMHILPELGDRTASSISPGDIQSLREKLEQKRPESGRGKNDENARLAAGTVMHVLKTVREVFNFALETPAPGEPSVMLFSGQNPARMSRRGRGVRPPQKDSRRLRILNDEEIGKLLAYKGVREEEFAELHDMILLSLDTGPRAGELCHLLRESVDAKNGTVRVLKGSDADRSTKGGLARVVHAGGLFPECLEMLRRRMETPSESPYLFPGKDGQRRDNNGLNRAMRRIMEKLGFNKGVADPQNLVVWHTLRHTYATRMLEAGCDIYALKELMGHASVTTTEGYLHLCDRAKREAALARITLARQEAAKQQAGAGQKEAGAATSEL